MFTSMKVSVTFNTFQVYLGADEGSSMYSVFDQMTFTENLFLLLSTYGLIMNTGALKLILNTPSIDIGPRLASRGFGKFTGMYRGPDFLVLVGIITPGNLNLEL